MPSSISSPRTPPGSRRETAPAHDVDRVHVPMLVVQVVRLGVAEIEAALVFRCSAEVTMYTPSGCHSPPSPSPCRCDSPSPARIASHRPCAHPTITGSASAGRQVIVVRPLPLRRSPRRRRRQVVVVRRLIVELRNRARRLRAESILLRCIRIPSAAARCPLVALSDSRVT